jgi:gluconolactonase
MTKSGKFTHLYLLLGVGMLTAALQGQEQRSLPKDGGVTKLDPGLDALVSPDAKVEKLTGGLKFAEGAVWVRKPGYIIFSDIPVNVVYKWTPEGGLSPLVNRSGYTGPPDDPRVGSPINNGADTETLYLIGSNGVTLDKQGRIVVAAHGDRAIVRFQKDGKRTIVADRYNGKRLNSPNDLVYKSNGILYFTDPPAGLRPVNGELPQKEQPLNRVYFIAKNGSVKVATEDVTFPNGLAFSPDEKYLYVDDTLKRELLRFQIAPDGSLTHREVFFDMSTLKVRGVADGMKVDKKGNIYCTGPGGVLVLSPGGRHLGTIVAPELPANVAFGDRDGKTLYMPARTGLYRIHVNVEGIRP